MFVTFLVLLLRYRSVRNLMHAQKGEKVRSRESRKKKHALHTIALVPRTVKDWEIIRTDVWKLNKEGRNGSLSHQIDLFLNHPEVICNPVTFLWSTNHAAGRYLDMPKRTDFETKTSRGPELSLT
jgi:hypothetical protein